MSTSDSKSRSVWVAAAWVLAWITLGLFFGGQRILYAHYAGRTPDLRYALVVPVIDMFLWALLALVVVALSRRVPFRGGAVLRPLAAHAAAAVVCSVTHSIVAGTALLALGLVPQAGASPARVLGGIAIGNISNNVFTYAVIVAITHAFDLWNRYRDRELAASRLEARLADARLDVLRMQLQPHFLFNTLHVISALMHRDPDTADRMLTRLSDLLRLSMERENQRDVSLAREIEFISGYLEIQQARFGERLRTSVRIDPAALDARVPTLLLQPLVENAIQHGIGGRADGGTVEISAQVRGDALEIEVRDDGVGVPAGGALPASGRGLANTRARLEQLYGPRHRIALGSRPGGGACVHIVVPLAPDAATENGRP